MVGRPTSVGPLVGAHVSKVDDMLAVQTVEEDGEPVGFDLADGHAERLDPRGGDGQKGVCAHGSDSMPSAGVLASPARAFGSCPGLCELSLVANMRARVACKGGGGAMDLLINA